jgi:very-short-patch-repair endonuclease
MRARLKMPLGLTQLARQQAGVVSRQQALGFGLTPTVLARLVDEGRWAREEPGIYLVSVTEPSWLSRVWGAVLLGGPDARVAGLAAAALSGLVDDEPLPIEILIPFGRRVRNRDWVVFRQERDRVRAVSTRAEPPRIRIEDTVLDLCAQGSESACIDWVTVAVQRRLTSPQELRASLARRSRQPHRKLLHGLLTDVASGVHSTLEHRYLHDVERAHGLPTASRQRTTDGRREFVDLLYLGRALVVELDGKVGHVGEGRFRDRRRDNRNARQGLSTLRFGWHEVTGDPCGVALEVAEMLIGLGWSGYPEQCPRCR